MPTFLFQLKFLDLNGTPRLCVELQAISHQKLSSKIMSTDTIIGLIVGASASLSSLCGDLLLIQLRSSLRLFIIFYFRLTNSSPFIENENQEIRLRILERKVDWHTLSTSAASYEGLSDSLNPSNSSNDQWILIINPAQGFIRQLLVPDPRCRMSLTSALDDPWLAQHIPFHLNNDPSSDHDDDNMIPDAEPDARMESSVAEMQAGPGTSTNNGSRPLQRRSLVLSQAAEAGIRLPEPSLEMIDYVSSRDEPSNIASTAVKGPNKRVRADLTPLPEELPDDANMSNPSPNTADVNRRAGDEDSRRRSSRRGKIPRMG